MNDDKSNVSVSHTKHSMSVSELNRKVKDLLEIHLPLIWVEGEVSNLSKPSSGHWYFTLKDEKAQIRCAMFRNRNTHMAFKPSHGDHIRVRARVSLYEGRGDYQLIVEHIEDIGFGLLQRRYEELKQKLSNEGLFDAAFKKPLPALPKHIGLITSPTGAAVRDFIHVLQRRLPSTAITLFPSAVQGEHASEGIIQAIDLAHEYNKCDVLVVCRGGGSIEDLWAFNNESLARVIFSAQTPIVSAIGHEIDFTICDFVADLRAPTPSAAAEMITPDKSELLEKLTRIEHRLIRAIKHDIDKKSTRYHHLKTQLKHPGERLSHWHQRLDETENRLQRTITHIIHNKQVKIAQNTQILAQLSPSNTIAQHKKHLNDLKQRLITTEKNQLNVHRLNLQNAITNLEIISPLATLRRGYTIVKSPKNQLIKNAADAKKEKNLVLQFHDGEVNVKLPT